MIQWKQVSSFHLISNLKFINLLINSKPEFGNWKLLNKVKVYAYDSSTRTKTKEKKRQKNQSRCSFALVERQGADVFRSKISL